MIKSQKTYIGLGHWATLANKEKESGFGGFLLAPSDMQKRLLLLGGGSFPKNQYQQARHLGSVVTKGIIESAEEDSTPASVCAFFFK